jgi:radical SAM superfamily enzyme YgiQ (UPF0313 family)
MANARNATHEKLSIMKSMNCVSISIGIENGNDYIRKDILKRRESKEDIIRAVKDMNTLGIRTSSFNMLALPFDNRGTIMETISLNKESQVRYPNCGFFFPLDQTELKDISVKNGFCEENCNILDTNSPYLELDEISKEEIVKLRERFLLYVKMPQEFYLYIVRSEEDDKIGMMTLDYLYVIYDQCVFSNDGVWDAKGRESHYLNELKNIEKNYG